MQIVNLLWLNIAQRITTYSDYNVAVHCNRYVYTALLVSSSRPSMQQTKWKRFWCSKRVWCSECHFISHGWGLFI